MINLKIKYHENKINGNSNEEDIKNWETKIKHLQKELFEARKCMLSKKKGLNLDTIISIN